jgi:hypothetical protein
LHWLTENAVTLFLAACAAFAAGVAWFIKLETGNSATRSRLDAIEKAAEEAKQAAHSLANKVQALALEAARSEQWSQSVTEDLRRIEAKLDAALHK